MINELSGLGYGIIGLAVVLGIGIVVLASMSSTLASCPSGFAWNTNGSDTFTANTCCLSGGADCTTGANHTAASKGSQTITTMNGYLGTSSGGVASWIPLVIVMVIGMMFLGKFLTNQGKTY